MHSVPQKIVQNWFRQKLRKIFSTFNNLWHKMPKKTK